MPILPHFAVPSTGLQQPWRTASASLTAPAHHQAATPTNSADDMRYLAIHIMRPSHCPVWGLSLSMFNDHVILGNIRTVGRLDLTSWCHVSSKIQPLLSYCHRSPSCDLSTYRVKLQRYFKCLEEEGNPFGMPQKTSVLDTLVNQQKLLPGDCIAVIDGVPVSRFPTLNDVTDYLREQSQATLVVIRSPVAVVQANRSSWWYCLKLPPPTEQNQRTLQQISYDAYMVYRASQQPQAQNNIATNVNAMPTVRRQVTPDVKFLKAHTQRALVKSAPAFASPPKNQVCKTEQPVSSSSKKVSAQSSISPLDLLCTTAASLKTVNTAATLTLPMVPSRLAFGSTPEKGQQMPCFVIPESWRNTWFEDPDTKTALPYDDNMDFDIEDGNRAPLFVKEVKQFPEWLAKRKTSWKKRYTTYKVDAPEEPQIVVNDDDADRRASNVAQDFWKTSHDMASFSEWLIFKKVAWKRQYSWSQQKRKRIQEEYEEVITLPASPSEKAFKHWLHVRKNQWRLQRRKRQRLLQEESAQSEAQDEATNHDMPENESTLEVTVDRKPPPVTQTSDFALLDAILEDEERQRRAKASRPPMDILFLFDSSLGAPDDIVTHCLKFLPSSEHSNLLMISKSTREKMQSRHHVWRQLCPTHWKLPRRPRKPWHEMYFHKLRTELRNAQKRCDDLLLKCLVVLTKRDHQQKIEKIVSKGERDFRFSVDYVSPVVCERNGLLNLAVIHRRHKVVRWLIEEKGANIESSDRGNFTPLINAAWAGDKWQVRFLLQHGADRNKIGTGHYSRPLAHSDFKGFPAEGWAGERGHKEIAKLIQIGL